MTREEYEASITEGGEPPEGLSPELESLWLTKAQRWDEAHDIAQDIPTSMGSWIHAHLHVIEGDLGNAGYWYNRAGREPSGPERLREEWNELVDANWPGDA